jgi:hypothetical protein
MLPDSERERALSSGSLGRLRVRVNPDCTEIVTEPSFHEPAGSGVKWLPGRAQHLMHDAGHLAAGGDGRPGRLGLKLPAFLVLTGCAFSTELRLSEGGGNVGIGHPHHIAGDAIRLILKWIVDVPDNELPLNDAWLRRRREGRLHLRLVRPFRRKYRNFAEVP